MLVNFKIGRIIEPIREIYEAFVIYTFYKLLVLMLGGERKIILMTVNKEPTSHPFPNSLFLKKVNISDPHHFLTIKRCILQYVWVKPLLYLIILVTSVLGIYDVNDVSSTSIFVWLGIFYNMSVTLSLYSLAMFWKCLYSELSIFNPWRKFLCVKLIIFASYWQGLIIGLFTWLGMFKDVNTLKEINNTSNGGNLGIQLQNGLLCLEMVFFAWLHWNSFPYTDFTAESIPDGARMKPWMAMKDWIKIGDLIYDFKITTMYGDSYNLRNFDSITDAKVYNSSDTFNQKIYQGLRVSANGNKYWINTIDDQKNYQMFKHNDENCIYSDAIENQAKLIFGSASNNILNNNINTIHSNKVDDTTSLLSKNSQNYVSTLSEIFPNSTNSEEELLIQQDDRLYRYVQNHYLTEDEINYPVLYDEYRVVDRTERIRRLRASLENLT
jgi:hypothetical protein